MDDKTKQQIQSIKETFGNACVIDPNMDNLQKWFKKDYVSPFKKGTKCYIDLRFFFKFDKTRNWKKLFDNNPWQPVIITYKRQDVIFFKWADYPNYPEEYFMEEAVNSAWCKNIYPSVIKYSDIFKKKIQRLKKNKPTELEVQIGILTINDMNGQIEIINDVII
jgi:hypothetical protein